MIIKVANNFYKMPKGKATSLLKIASEQVPQGIFAVELLGKGYIELMNMPMGKAEIKKARKEYGKRGMRIYANE